jgi:hypothetical protein
MIFPFLIISSGLASYVARGNNEVDLVCLPLGAITKTVESKQWSHQVKVAIFNGNGI